jgi:hypothetical protein
MLAAIDEAFEHIELLSAIDEAFEHVELLNAIDEAFAHIDSLDKVNALETTHVTSSTDMTAVIATAGALLAIGAGFVIKSKFNAVQKRDEQESLL